MRNKERKKAYDKQYRENHSEEIREYQRQWYIKNKEKQKKWFRQYLR